MNLDIQGHHNWRQSQTMWNVLNFARHDANILNPRVSNFNNNNSNILRYEFPIMQWSTAMLIKVFGEHILLVRLVQFVIGLFSILGIFFLIHHITQRWDGALIGATLMLYSPLFYFYHINPIPDNLALCAAIWYSLFILKHIDTQRTKYLILASILLLIATLSKLPFLMFAIISITHFIVNFVKSKKLELSNLRFAYIQLIWIIPALLWYAWVMPTWSQNSVTKGIFFKDTPWKEFKIIFDYHRDIMFPKIILYKYSWPIFLLGILYLLKVKKYKKYILSVIGITFLYLFLEFIPIGIVHDYYMLPFLLWMYVVVGIGASYILKYSKFIIIPLLAVCLFSMAHTSKVTKEKWSIHNSGFDPSLYTQSKELREAVPQNEKCIILNDRSSYIFSYRIDKMGFIFNNDHLPAKWIYDMIVNYDVQYMYSDSYKVNNDPEVKSYIEKTILTAGSINVYKLIAPEKATLVHSKINE